MVRLVLASVVLVLVAACGPRTPQDEVYQAGYDEGCATANALGARGDGGVRRPGSGQLQRGNEPYLRGWRDGHATCAEGGFVADTSLSPRFGAGLSPLPF
jgi:hypothetical protein